MVISVTTVMDGTEDSHALSLRKLSECSYYRFINFVNDFLKMVCYVGSMRTGGLVLKKKKKRKKMNSYSFSGSSDREESTSPEKAQQQRTPSDRKRKRKSTSSSQGAQSDEGGGGAAPKMSRATETKKINEYFNKQSPSLATNSPHRHSGAKSPSPQTHLGHMVSFTSII